MIRAMPGEKLAKPVTFFGMFNFPVAAYLGFMNNHSIHHRGQLATYLRPMGAKVPSIYGGSYDEPFQALVAGCAGDFREGAKRAAEAIDSGAARGKLEGIMEFVRSAK